MVDIEKLKIEIVERLETLDPDKIILFGSYAYGDPTEYSDVDLFLLKDLELTDLREFEFKARRKLRDLIFKYRIGFDILSAPESFVNRREDYFYRIDILERGVVIYAKQN